MISSLPFLFSYFTVTNSRHKLLFQLETMVTEKKKKTKTNKQTQNIEKSYDALIYPYKLLCVDWDENNIKRMS